MICVYVHLRTDILLYNRMLLTQALCSVVIKEREFRKRLTDLTLTFFFRNLTGRGQFLRIEIEGIYDSMQINNDY